MDDVTIVVIVALICVTIIGLVEIYYKHRRETAQKVEEEISRAS